jgi:hypothetical protein
MPRIKKYHTPEEKREALNAAAKRYNRKKREEKLKAEAFLEQSEKVVKEMIEIKKIEEDLKSNMVDPEPIEVSFRPSRPVPLSKPMPSLIKSIFDSKWRKV